MDNRQADLAQIPLRSYYPHSFQSLDEQETSSVLWLRRNQCWWLQLYPKFILPSLWLQTSHRAGVVEDIRCDHYFSLSLSPCGQGAKAKAESKWLCCWDAPIHPLLHAFNSLYHMLYTAQLVCPSVDIQVCLPHLDILECWSVTRLPPLCSHGKVQAISRKPHLSPIPEGCAIISCKTGNKQSHLPCSVEWKRSVRLPTLSCASSLYFVRKIHATFQKPWLSQAGKRWGQGPRLHCKRCIFHSKSFVAPS